MEVNLIQKPYDDVFEKVEKIIQSDLEIQMAYSNHINRIKSGYYVSLIEYYNKDVGYINLNDECTNEFLFLDIGIIEKYRGKGISELALQKLLCNDFKQYLIAQVEQKNVSSNKMARHIGVNICSFGDNNIYLLQRDREAGFKEEDGIPKIKKHFLSQVNL